jgi:hypothetical protein
MWADEDKLVADHMPGVVKWAGLWRTPEIQDPDKLLEYGVKALQRCARRFDPSRAKFVTFLSRSLDWAEKSYRKWEYQQPWYLDALGKRRKLRNYGRDFECDRRGDESSDWEDKPRGPAHRGRRGRHYHADPVFDGAVQAEMLERIAEFEDDADKLREALRVLNWNDEDIDVEVRRERWKKQQRDRRLRERRKQPGDMPGCVV